MSATNGINRYLIVFSTLLLAAAIFSGCGKAPREGEEIIRTDCTPRNLKVQPNSGQFMLMWDPGCPDSIMISGYYVYLEQKPIDDKYHATALPKSIKPYNETVYPGDTDPDNKIETMLINDLQNGREYYVSVRTVFPDGSISVSSNEVTAIPRPEGTFTLSFRYSDTTDGFSFALGNYVRADGDLNDIYFYSKDGIDYIASPHRLNGFLRHSEFYSLGKTDDIYQYSDLNLDIPPVDKMPVRIGESYLVKTADDKFAKLRVMDVKGEGKERTLKLKYIYQTAKNLMRF